VAEATIKDLTVGESALSRGGLLDALGDGEVDASTCSVVEIPEMVLVELFRLGTTVRPSMIRELFATKPEGYDRDYID
jgi:hypothetical protein